MEVISVAGVQYNSLEITVCGVCVCVGGSLNPACRWRRSRSWGTGQGHNAYKTPKGIKDHRVFHQERGW